MTKNIDDLGCIIDYFTVYREAIDTYTYDLEELLFKVDCNLDDQRNIKVKKIIKEQLKQYEYYSDLIEEMCEWFSTIIDEEDSDSYTKVVLSKLNKQLVYSTSLSREGTIDSIINSIKNLSTTNINLNILETEKISGGYTLITWLSEDNLPHQFYYKMDDGIISFAVANVSSQDLNNKEFIDFNKSTKGSEETIDAIISYLRNTYEEFREAIEIDLIKKMRIMTPILHYNKPVYNTRGYETKKLYAKHIAFSAKLHNSKIYNEFLIGDDIYEVLWWRYFKYCS